MSSRHEVIKWKLISDWSVEKRGRLYCMNQGMATPLHGENPIWFGPLKRKFKGFSDTFGFEYENSKMGMRLPVFTVIEVKTRNDDLSKDQRDFLDYIKSTGGNAYVAWEADNEKGYHLQEWL